MVYLYVGPFLSKAPTAAATRHPRVSAGTVTTMTARTVGGLVGFLGLVRDRIAVADAAQFDETSLRVDGKQRWTQ